MAVKMRLSRKGRKKAPFYHIVVADARSPRDGRFIQKLGTYNPMTKPATIEIDRVAAYDWLTKGAQPTDTVKAILRFKGVYYRKHLMRGVSKGALTLEQADQMWQKWIDEKEAKIAARKADTMAELEAFRKMVSGEAKPAKIVADASAAEAFREDSSEHTTAEAEVEVSEEVSAAEESPAEDSVSSDETPAEETAASNEAPAEAASEEAEETPAE